MTNIEIMKEILSGREESLKLLEKIERDSINDKNNISQLLIRLEEKDSEIDGLEEIIERGFTAEHNLGIGCFNYYTDNLKIQEAVEDFILKFNS
jgi:methyl coenzyme M reductase subunit D